MNTTSRAAMAAAALTLSVSPIVLAGPAVADGGGKAAIERAERQAEGSGVQTKAQIEQRERHSAPSGGMTRAQLEARWRAQAESGGDFTGGARQPSPNLPSPSGDGGAAAWQLALSAALGAVMAGGVLVAVRQVGQHRPPMASAH